MYICSFIIILCPVDSGCQHLVCCSHKAGVNPEEGFFTHEVYSDDIFFKLAEAAISFLGKTTPC